MKHLIVVIAQTAVTTVTAPTRADYFFGLPEDFDYSQGQLPGIPGSTRSGVEENKFLPSNDTCAGMERYPQLRIIHVKKTACRCYQSLT
jgi:hypothetical protein